jgi:hypothetical protein
MISERCQTMQDDATVAQEISVYALMHIPDVHLQMRARKNARQKRQLPLSTTSDKRWNQME